MQSGRVPITRPGDSREGEGFFIKRSQNLKGCIGVAVGLEIDKVLFRPAVPHGMEIDPFGNLLMQVLFGIAVGWIECVIVAISATTRPFGPVAVGTGKPCINNHFLYPSSECLPDIFGVRVKPALMPPWVWGPGRINLLRPFQDV